MLEPPKTSREAALDEAGRGALAFPVVAAAVIWDPARVEPDGFVEKINDSKKLTKRAREHLADYIKEHALAYSIRESSPAHIDRVNILQATMDAMHACLDALPPDSFDGIVVDGSYFRRYGNVPHECVVGGDTRLLAVAAASILAKTHRDALVRRAVAEEPALASYDMDRNVGYPTPRHKSALGELGPTRHHRLSYRCVPSRT